MSQQTIVTSSEPEVRIAKIGGNLQLKGWDRAEVNVKADPEDLQFEGGEDAVALSCEGSCTIRLPVDAAVQASAIHGHARIKSLEGPFQVEAVHGSLTLRDVVDAHLGRVHGELSARYVEGDLKAEVIEGNASVRDVRGDCSLGAVHGNLDLRDVDGSVKAEVKGNVNLRLSQVHGSEYQVDCDGNLQCRLSEGSDLRLRLTSGGESIFLSLPEGDRSLRQKEAEITLGTGAVLMELSADGNLSVVVKELDEEPEDLEAEDFGRLGEFNQEIARQVEAQIQAQMEAMTRQLNEQMANLSSQIGKVGLSQEDTEEILQHARETTERASARAQEKLRRAQEKLERKLEAARRRNEMKAQAVERRAQTQGRRPWGFEWSPPSPPAPPRGPAPQSQSTEEERMMVLKMLEQKKITLQEAEQLLAALEGKE